MSPHQPELHDMLSYEVRKEMADRYFGFRRLIEEDKLDFLDKTRQFSFILEKRISFDLIRLYILLGSDDIIKQFLALTGIPAQTFYDPCLIRSETIKERVFSGIQLRGFTRWGRLKNLVYACYQRLELHAAEYADKLAELAAQQAEINSAIEQFHKNNDFVSILGFLRALGDPARVDGMEGGLEMGLASSLDEKMRIEPPLPVDHYLPVMPKLPPFRSIQGEIRKLAKAAKKHHGSNLVDLLDLIVEREGVRGDI